MPKARDSKAQKSERHHQDSRTGPAFRGPKQGCREEGCTPGLTSPGPGRGPNPSPPPAIAQEPNQSEQSDLRAGAISAPKGQPGAAQGRVIPRGLLSLGET